MKKIERSKAYDAFISRMKAHKSNEGFYDFMFPVSGDFNQESWEESIRQCQARFDEEHIG